MTKKLMQHCLVARRRDCFPRFIDVRTGGRPLNDRLGVWASLLSLAVPFAAECQPGLKRNGNFSNVACWQETDVKRQVKHVRASEPVQFLLKTGIPAVASMRSATRGALHSSTSSPNARSCRDRFKTARIVLANRYDRTMEHPLRRPIRYFVPSLPRPNVISSPGSHISVRGFLRERSPKHPV